MEKFGCLKISLCWWVPFCCLYLLLVAVWFVELLRRQSDDKVCRWKLEYDFCWLLEHSVLEKNCRLVSFLRTTFLLSREGCPSQKLRVVVLAVESFIFSIDKNVSRGPLCDPFKKNGDASRQSDSLMDATDSIITYLV